MKKLLLLLLLCANLIMANDNKTKSKLSKVTVYLNGAQIIRTANLNLLKGTTEFTFVQLSPYIQESSIQISGLKNTSILSINYGINYLSKHDNSEGIETLKNRIKALQDHIQFENNFIAGYNEELSIIQTNRQLGNENEVVNLEKLQRFASYFRKRSTEIKGSIYRSEQKKNAYAKQITEIKKQLNEFQTDDKVQTGEIKVKLNTSSVTSLNLIIQYNVTNAGWFPVYDLKAAKINAPLQLVYKAHVYQSTGSNWVNVKLTLSTSDPNTNNIKPDVNSKYLNFINRYSKYQSNRATRSYNYKYNPLVQTISGIVADESGPLPGASVIVKGTTIGTETDFDGKYSIKPNGGKELIYSFIGFQAESIPIHSSIMNVSMEEDINRLEEVVVTGYGTTSRLRGTASGVKIRGVSSIKRDKIPLIVIDGVISTSENYSNINPELIESIKTLKGFEGKSIYGARANDGAIVITTKKGVSTSNGDIIEEGIANTRFEIKKLYSIPTDGDITVIEVDNYSVPATYVYFAAPIVNENVFLTAKIGNWEQYNLLPGEANVYFEGSYSGKTNINPQAISDSLTLSLGVDPNVVIKRNQLSNFKKNSFTGNNRILNKSYKIELKNNKLSDINLIVMDRIPVSQNKEIKVDDIDSGTSNFNRKKGILEWKINLPLSGG